MSRLTLATAAAVLAAIQASACAPAARLGTTKPPAAVTDDSARWLRATTQHVVIISIDGLRPDAIERYPTPTLHRLMAQGYAFLDAKTVVPSLTLPSHTSMLTGLPPDQHGIVWNDDQVVGRGLVPLKTVFALAREAGLTTAAFFGKAKFRHLMVPGTLDYAQAPTGWWGRWFADRTTIDVRNYLAGGARPNLLFVHIGEPDYAGHSGGWMSWLYGRGVGTADRAVNDITAAASMAFGRNYTLIVTADHGGHGRTHGTADSVDVTIPWITWGAGVLLPASGERQPIRTMDTAATALWLLGLDVPSAWAGRPVTEPFLSRVKSP